jgi:type VI secretion system protein ImpM
MRANATPESRHLFPTGWYGKIPAAGDFVARRIPPDFGEVWHDWLHNALEGSRQRLAGRWPDDFLSMPVWRFVFSPGLVTPSAWVGLMLPSVDAVGRYFPLAFACRLPATGLDLVATLFLARAWFGELEEIGLSAIAQRVDFAAVDAAIAERPFQGAWMRHARGRPSMMCVELGSSPMADIAGMALRASAERLSEPCGAWLAEPSDLFGRSLLLCEALPSAEQLCAMMDGRWLEHGWMRHEFRFSS